MIVPVLGEYWIVSRVAELPLEKVGQSVVVGVIWLTCGLNHVLSASGLSKLMPSLVALVRVTDTPLAGVIVTLVVARICVVPATLEVIVAVQLPVPPEVEHVGEPTNEPGPLTMVKVIDVPLGAST